MENTIQNKLKLHSLLSSIEDCYGDFYFLTKNKMKNEGLDFFYKDEGKCFIYKDNCIFIKEIKDEDFTFDFMYYRKWFPLILIFEKDVVEIRNNKIFLISEDPKRFLVEDILVQRDFQFHELVTRLDIAFRISLEPKDILKFFKIESNNPLKDYASFNRNHFWGQLNDLQVMYETLLAIQSNRSLDSYIDLTKYIIEINKSL